jgi:NTE family protein
MILVHQEHTSPYGTERWLQDGRFTRHHHVRAWNGADFERVARLVTGRAHGLVLGGGGARGFAHLGVLRAFEEAKIPIDIIGGTSMGAVIAAEYVTGHSVDAMIDLTRRSFVDRNPITDYTIPLVSLISGGRMARVLGRMFGDVHIEDLWRPYFCVATNLSRATVTVHREGPLKYAVATSIAVPGLAPPLIHRGDFLVDGGLLDNVPVAVMRQVSQGTVFAVDVSQRVEFKAAQEPYAYLSGWRALRDRLRGTPRHAQVPSMLKLLWRSTVLNSIHRSETVQKLSDVYIHPDVDGVEIFDWHALDKAVDVGYRAASEALGTRVSANATTSCRLEKWSSGVTSGSMKPAARTMLLTETSASAI